MPSWKSATFPQRNATRSRRRCGPRETQSAETVLTQASQILSGMSRGAGLVLAAKAEGALKHIEFVQAGADQGALAVLVSAER